MRIISDNAADRASLAASSTMAGLAVDSLLTDSDTEVHRSNGTSVTYTIAFPISEMVGGVHLPWTNLSPTASIRVRGYSDAGASAKVIDTGVIFACPAPAIRLARWEPIDAASAYAYGGGAHARAWFSNTAARVLVVDIVDVDNLQGYVEAGRIVAGKWWEPEESADYDAPLGFGSMSKQSRSDAGRLVTQIGTKYRMQSIGLSHLATTDRKAVLDIVRANDIDVPLIFSLYPNSTDNALERDHQMYCKFVVPASLKTPGYERYATSLEMETV
ncbi:MAG: hypothetical protein ABIV04_07235 [Massilia sp.]